MASDQINEASSDQVLVSIEDCLDHEDTLLEKSVCLITLNRESKRNAITLGMYEKMAETFEQLQTKNRDSVASVVITGRGKHFTGGNDLHDFFTRPPSSDRKHPIRRFMTALLDLQLPVIVAIEGHAVGIGSTLLTHCDFVYAHPESSFSMPFVPLGLVPEFASSQLIPERAGDKRAKEWLLLGKSFGANEALAGGLISAIDPSPLSRAMKTAAELAVLPRQALIEAKGLLHGPKREELERVIDREIEKFTQALQGDAFKRNVQAFLNK